MGGLDDRRSQRRAGRLDQAGVRHAVAAGGVARTGAAEPRQLLAGAEPVKPANLGAQRPRRHRTNAWLLLQSRHFRIIGRRLRQPLLHLLDVVGHAA